MICLHCNGGIADDDCNIFVKMFFASHLCLVVLFRLLSFFSFLLFSFVFEGDLAELFKQKDELDEKSKKTKNTNEKSKKEKNESKRNKMSC
jgi:flagellar biosynthesis component FlhA